MRMIVLAAGEGRRLRPLTSDRPKCLVELGGETLLDRQARIARIHGIDEIVIVGGHGAEYLPRAGARVTVNDAYRTTNMAYSLFRAEAYFGDEFVMSYGDIAYAPTVLASALADAAPVSVVVDRDWRSYWELRSDDPLADAESLRIGADGNLRSIGQRETEIGNIEAQYIGLVVFRGSGVEALRSAYGVASADEAADRRPFGGGRSLHGLFMTDLLQGMIDLGYPLHAVPVHGGWVEIDSFRDLDVAERLVRQGRLS